MTNVPAALRETLPAAFTLRPATWIKTDGSPCEARKLLVGLPDGEAVESMLIPAPDRRTVCVSTQVGCKYRCAFCASGQAGFKRNLEAGEIVGQVLLAWETFEDRPTNVVFMGIGEPLENYDAVLKSVRILNDSQGMNIGARRLTISTCGVVPGIQRLSEEGIQVELSVSLHAPDDALRSRLMPANRAFPLGVLLAACRAYTEKTRRIITFEYTLIRGVNDNPAQARELAALLSSFPCRVNLIPLSPVEEFDGEPSEAVVAERFQAILVDARINTTLRVSKGRSVQGACGQLRYRKPGAE
jgi:23S rRNA (adenine2503-C2)-methyltransferase